MTTLERCLLPCQDLSTPEAKNFMNPTPSKQSLESDATPNTLQHSGKNSKTGEGNPSLDKVQVSNPMPAQRPQSGRHNFSSTNLFIYDLHHSVGQEILEKHFSVFGKILSSAVMRNIHTGESLGTAFVEFETHEQAHEAMVAMSGSILEGKTIFVQWARKHERIPVGEARRKIMKLFVRNIPLDITVDDLTKFFSEYGSVNQVTIHKDTAPVPDPMLVRHIAFVIYGEEGAAEKAAVAVQNTKPFESCNGIPLMVKLAEDNGRERKHHHSAGKSSSHYCSTLKTSGSFKKKSTDTPLPILQTQSTSQPNSQFIPPTANPYPGWGGTTNSANNNYITEEHANTLILLRNRSCSDNLTHDRETYPIKTFQQSALLSPSQERAPSFRNQSPGCVKSTQRTQSSVSFLNFEDYPMYPPTLFHQQEQHQPLSRRSNSSHSLQHSRVGSLVFRDDFYAPSGSQTTLPLDTVVAGGTTFDFDSATRGAYTPTHRLSRYQSATSSDIADSRFPNPYPVNSSETRYECPNTIHVPHCNWQPTSAQSSPSGFPARQGNSTGNMLHHCASSGGIYTDPSTRTVPIPNPRSALGRTATMSALTSESPYHTNLYPRYHSGKNSADCWNYNADNNFYNNEGMLVRGENEGQMPETRIQRVGSVGYPDWASIKSPLSEEDPNTTGGMSGKSRTSSFKDVSSSGARSYRHNPYSFQVDS
ncbi:unnamed protein product [Phytomonas sp. EM1]|nr:unnamed protein product [Phytomonas sp. EM1]|eukprot:CCW59646.1 unnamed protein product [Phytomonas sp. isolate EM1]